MSISIDGCREFVMLAEHLSFSKAAAALHMSQPALSKHIAALERDLGRRLLVRGSRGLTLTTAGVKFLEACVSIVETYEASVAEIRRTGRRESYSLALAGPLYIKEIASLVSECAAAVRRHYELQTHLTAESSTPYLNLLRSGKVDLAITSLSRETIKGEIESMRLYRWRLCVAVREDHRLAREPGDVPFAALDGETVRLEEGVTLYGLRRRFLDLSESHDIRLKLRARQCSIYDRHLDEVSKELILTSEEIMENFVSPGFVVKRIADADCMFDIRICWRRHSDNPAVPLFLAQMQRLLGSREAKEPR